MTKRKLGLAIKDLLKLEKLLDEFQDDYYANLPQEDFNKGPNDLLNSSIALLSDIITVLEIEHNGTEEDL
jgi:hypothetical protein